ncbi:hypothetical protein OLL86_08390 [Gallibacterium anatis]|uniref:hypothetical protein n=1 Tax=Gallibacterium anatis TaxID=750 RepID=UPI000531CD09|nr:hypothetical protein [Gallibacterium anatis]KGQ23550.1 hypothetical protein JP27_10945 [Gallibacterium anatis]KGQ26958.1 hypothetical protein JP33_00930 [Gallibacterium anatis CCM5995]KGQ55244.1 hypothetical protein IO44_07145 [Gallibacterium anatis str. Avicor]MBP4134129.1 hypothetical protein [Gallibacterium anatis]UZD15531.1 hypothetical protein OLL86_08390 [Gallibacterium anatis]
MEQQQQLLNQIAQLLHSHCDKNYDEANLKYEFLPDGSWQSFSAWFTKDGKNHIPYDFSELKEKAEKLCETLYLSMKEENDWRKITFKIDKERKAIVNYSYNE